MSIYLSYFDRELCKSVAARLSANELKEVTNTLLLFSYERMYCGLALIWENPECRRRSLWNPIKLMLKSEALQTLTSYPTASDYLIAKRREYAHDVDRYPVYYAKKQEDEIASFAYFDRLTLNTTASLVRQLSDWSANASGPFEDLREEQKAPLADLLLSDLDTRGERAVTSSMFEPSLAGMEGVQTVRGAISRMISVAYSKHYMNAMRGLCATGVTGLAYYDQVFSASFPYLDLPVLRRVREVCSLKIESTTLRPFLDSRGSIEHVHFVHTVRQLLSECSDGLGELPYRRASVAEALTARMGRLFGRKMKRIDPMDWKARFREGIETLTKITVGRDGEFRIIGSGMVNVRAVESVSLVLVTATPVEFEEALRLMTDPVTEYHGSASYSRGRFAGHSCVLTRCDPGTLGANAATLAVDEALRLFQPVAVVMVGIAFGANETKQALGDVLVATTISPYESQRVGTSGDGSKSVIRRGPKPEPGRVLAGRFRDRIFGWTGAKVHPGVVLSGEKLVDNLEFKNELLTLEPEAKGGEMEGSGLYAAAAKHGVEWILVKAICDWGDGHKKDTHHRIAAANASSLVHHVLNHPDVLRDCRPFYPARYAPAPV